MASTVKGKIRLGTSFLFLLLLLSGGVGIYHLVRLKNDAKLILKDNYESLEYCHSMQRALDSTGINSAGALLRFDSALKLQETNVTEPGELQASASIRAYFNRYRSGDSSLSVVRGIRNSIQHILSLNMSAIEIKNHKANHTADNALTYISLIAAIVFLVGFTFSVNFPSVLTSPVNALTKGIQEIGKKNYHHRIHLDRKDEFGQMADAFNDMAERLEYFESSNLNKIIFEKTRAEAVINSLKEASIGIDKNDVILFANDQALYLLGMQAKDIVGKPVSDVTKRNDLFRFLLEEKGSLPFKIILDNRENYFIKEIMEIAQDGSSSKVIALQNITSFKELDIAKTNFIATISHELKTPLAASDFSLKLLEDDRVGQLSEDQKELIGQLKNANQRMLRILSELLNMSQVETGKIQLNIQSVNLYQVVENSVMAVSVTAKEKKIKVEKKVEENLPELKADADKVSWVLNNFLTNAIKYSPSESTIFIDVKRTDNAIAFAVTDSGMGIDEMYLDRIFERYFQIPGRSDKKGSGIGLAICKEFIEAMGGKIWVKSQPGQGSVFGFDIRITQQEA